MLIDERKHPQKLQWYDQGANTMTDKITIERETLGRALDALVHHQDQTRPIELTQVAIDALRAALAAQPAESSSYSDHQQRVGAPLTFFTSVAAHAYRAAATRDDVTHEDAMRVALGEVDKARASTPAPAAMPDDKTGDGLPPLQAGLNNAELLSAWIKKLPGVEPTERQLTAFALGAEVGFAHAQDLERQDWSRMHHAFKDAGIHPGRTDDHLADVLRAAIAAAAARERELCAQACDARDMGDGSREDQEARRCAAAIRRGG